MFMFNRGVLVDGQPMTPDQVLFAETAVLAIASVNSTATQALG
jgi:hypothetical protein